MASGFAISRVIPAACCTEPFAPIVIARASILRELSEISAELSHCHALLPASSDTVPPLCYKTEHTQKLSELRD